jgi:hypothetical protein
MRKLLVLFLYFFGSLQTGVSQTPGFALVPTTPTTNVMVAGATSLTEISNALLLALQTNNTGQLSTYFPSDAELKMLQKIGSEDMRAVLEDKSAEDLQQSFATDLQKVIADGVTKTLNWTELLVSDTKASKTTTKNRMLLPVETRLQTKQNKAVALLYEVVKIKNRYFLFRGIQLKA